MSDRWMEPDPDEPSLNLVALWHDEGRICAECGTQFTQAHGEPVACEYCSNRGSEYPRAEFPEINKEAHRAEARKRRKAKEKRNVDSES